MQLRDAFGPDEERVRPDERWMCAEVDEAAVWPKHTPNLAQHRVEIIDVRVRPHRNCSVEARIRKGQRGSVRRHDFDSSFPRPGQQFLGDVHADDLPTARSECSRVRAGAAADVDQGAGSVSEEVDDRPTVSANSASYQSARPSYRAIASTPRW